MKRIANAFVDELLSHVDIVNVIDRRVPLKKSGRNLQACCPFHDEKTPSFTVSPTKQFYHCFGCGASGNALRFVMNYEHLSFVDAVEKLAEEHNIPVVYEHVNTAQLEKKKSLYELLDMVTDYYSKHLYTSTGSDARAYLTKRQLDVETAKFFRLGFSPSGNTLALTFGKTYSVDELQKAGLMAQGNNGFYDQFRERLMFPIRDARGRVLGFGARALGDAMPKYLNSTETTVFQKRFVLYGLYELLQSTTQIERLIVVEGYMDVIALHQMGVLGAVATLGTSFTPEHITLAQKYTKKIYICFDGDNAGKVAAERALSVILPAMRLDIEIRFVFLPDGEDPDSLVRKSGKQAFEALLNQGVLFSEFVYQTLIGDSELEFIEGRGEVAVRARKLFDSLPDSDFKTLLYQGLTEKLGMDIYRLADQTGIQPSPHSSANASTKANYHEMSIKGGEGVMANVSAAKAQHRQTSDRNTAESRLIRLFLLFPNIAKIVSHLELIRQQPAPSLDAMLLYKIMLFWRVNDKDVDETLSIFLRQLNQTEQQRMQQIIDDEYVGEGVSGESPEARIHRLQKEFIIMLEAYLNRLREKYYKRLEINNFAPITKG